MITVTRLLCNKIIRLLCCVVVILLYHNTAQAVGIKEQSIVCAEKYLNVREYTNNNDHPEIDKMLAYLGLPKRLSWCAAFVLTSYKDAAEILKVKQPLPKYGRVASLWEYCKKNPIRYKTFTAEQVRLGLVKLQAGDVIIWKHGDVKNGDFNGHTGLNISQINLTHIWTIEGNTLPNTSGNSGNQREGGGVYKRDRYIKSGNFSIIGFVRVN